MHFSKSNMRNPSGILTCPLAAAATFTNDYNITQLTEQVGCRSNKTLLAKLNNDNEFSHLTLEEAVKLTNTTNDLRIVKSWAAGLGYQLTPAATARPSDEEFSDQILQLSERVGGFMGAMRAARADGVISNMDLAQIKTASAKAIESILQLELECEAMVRDLGGDNE